MRRCAIAAAAVAGLTVLAHGLRARSAASSTLRWKLVSGAGRFADRPLPGVAVARLSKWSVLSHAVLFKRASPLARQALAACALTEFICHLYN